jgi:hypothetical protein
VHPKAKLVSWLGQPGWSRAFLYMCLLWGVAGIAYASSWGLALITTAVSPQTHWGVERIGFVTWFGLTFSHYYLDGIIWKLRKDAQVRQSLQIANAN